VAQKFDLVCQRKQWISWANAIFMSGVGTGVYISGMISDLVLPGKGFFEATLTL
jgi:hypothetical protein